MKKDSKRFKFLSHPLHPMFTHFPIALLAVSVFWDLLGLWSGKSIWWDMAYWSIAAGLVASVFTITTGLIDFTKMPQEKNIEKLAYRHMLIVIFAIILYTGSFFFRYGSPVLSGTRLYGALSLSVLGFIVLIIGSWFGGELVYRYGVGKKSNSPSE